MFRKIQKLENFMELNTLNRISANALSIIIQD